MKDSAQTGLTSGFPLMAYARRAYGPDHVITVRPTARMKPRTHPPIDWLHRLVDSPTHRYMQTAVEAFKIQRQNPKRLPASAAEQLGKLS